MFFDGEKKKKKLCFAVSLFFSFFFTNRTEPSRLAERIELVFWSSVQLHVIHFPAGFSQFCFPNLLGTLVGRQVSKWADPLSLPPPTRKSLPVGSVQSL